MRRVEEFPISKQEMLTAREIAKRVFVGRPTGFSLPRQQRFGIRRNAILHDPR